MVSEEVNKPYYEEIVASISDAKFTKNGRYIISRDFMTVKVSYPVNIYA